MGGGGLFFVSFRFVFKRLKSKYHLSRQFKHPNKPHYLVSLISGGLKTSEGVYITVLRVTELIQKSFLVLMFEFCIKPSA